MFARPSERERGFTLIELITVLLLVSILSVVAIPKLQGAVSFRDDAWHDQLVSALRYGQKVATSHRRLVCASVGAAGVSLSIASTNPATGCVAALPGLDGQPLAADSKGGGSASIGPAGAVYFQPSGRITVDGAGLTSTTRTISIPGQPDIVVIGETGHVE